MARSRPTVERLEDRTVPSSVAGAWPDGQQLSLSFVPDGTSVDGRPSALSATLGAALPQAAWETVILQAFQTWAVQANVNIGLVSDGGQPLGTAGAPQGDPRFGDIRVAAEPLADHVALSTPFNVLGGTRAGDVVLNSAAPFTTSGSGGYDLFAVALHEAGNVLGVPENNDPTSAMYRFYTGPRTSLSAADVAALQGLYGAPPADGSNTSFQSATWLGWGGTRGAVTAPGDADYYRFVAFDSRSLTVTVQAAGLSLLTPAVTVYDSSGHVVGQAATTDPLHNTVSVPLTGLTPGATYYVQVGGSRQDVFGMGAYQVSVSGGWNWGGAPTANNIFNNGPVVSYWPNSMAWALNLGWFPFHNDPRFDARVQGQLNYPGDGTYYKIAAPTTPAGALVVMAWGTGSVPLVPQVSVLDHAGNPVNATVLVSGGYSVLQVANPTPGVVYYLAVRGASGTTGVGGYELAVDFPAQALSVPSATSGILTQPQPEGWLTLQNSAGQLFHFVLSAGPAATVPAGVRMVIYNAQDQVVFSLLVLAGQTGSADVYLAPGTYTIRFEGGAANGAPLPALTYNLLALPLTRPLDPVPLDPTQDPTGTAPTYHTTTTDTSTYALLDLLDPYSDPLLGLLTPPPPGPPPGS
jgi:hypothetical protein